MRKILLTTTALIALGSVAAVAADVSVSGNARFRYNTWSDDNVDALNSGNNNNTMTDVLQLWVKSSATTDSGLSVGTNTRILTNGTVDRNWIDIDGDFGKIDLGKQWSLSYSGSLHENWMGTVAGGVYMGGSTNGAAVAARDAVVAQSGRAAVTTRAAAAATGLTALNSTGFIGGNKNNKVIYHMPAIGGFNAAVGYMDAGSGTDGDETSTHISYTMPMGAGSLKVNMASIATSAANATAAESDGREVGVQYSADFGRVYMVSQNTDTTTARGVSTNDQEGTTFGGQYNLNSATKIVYYRQEMDQDGTTDTGDKFSSDTVGVRYDMAGGLRVGLLHSSYDFTDAGNNASSENGSATRLQVRVNF